ncbi:MAG: hypothetical protein ACOCP8_01365 [archaeon]
MSNNIINTKKRKRSQSNTYSHEVLLNKVREYLLNQATGYVTKEKIANELKVKEHEVAHCLQILNLEGLVSQKKNLVPHDSSRDPCGGYSCNKEWMPSKYYLRVTEYIVKKFKSDQITKQEREKYLNMVDKKQYYDIYVELLKTDILTDHERSKIIKQLMTSKDYGLKIFNLLNEKQRMSYIGINGNKQTACKMLVELHDILTNKERKILFERIYKSIIRLESITQAGFKLNKWERNKLIKYAIKNENESMLEVLYNLNNPIGDKHLETKLESIMLINKLTGNKIKTFDV